MDGAMSPDQRHFIFARAALMWARWRAELQPSDVEKEAFGKYLEGGWVNKDGASVKAIKGKASDFFNKYVKEAWQQDVSLEQGSFEYTVSAVYDRFR
jgi:hypothetical protein